ncbi:MAG TPA: BrnT family toxin [Candidatus Udaeobacter sp.]|nr:BrnT family toxin [Candidatus Udaeobacter sp.]
MQFEFDPQKSLSNKAKHGIDLSRRRRSGNRSTSFFAPKMPWRRDIIGTIGGDYWSAIITYRGATIRIISVSKSTAMEIEMYGKIAG